MEYTQQIYNDSMIRSLICCVCARAYRSTLGAAVAISNLYAVAGYLLCRVVACGRTSRSRTFLSAISSWAALCRMARIAFPISLIGY